MKPNPFRKPLRKAASTPSAAAPEIYEIACLCGQLLKIRGSHDRKRCGCPSCGRKFLLTFTDDKGRKVPSPVYLSDAAASAPSGETFLADPGSDVSGPPAELLFPCIGCNRKILAKRAVYGKRVRCPDCSVRMIVDVVFDATLETHLVRPLRVEDPPSGMTSTNIELPKP